MKKLLISSILIAGTALNAFSAEKEVAKKGWNFGPVPAISYSTDSGFQYGVLSDIYYYGDGSKYPEYLYKFNVNVSAYTKGNKLFHLDFDSKYLIPNVRLSASISYFGNNTDQYWGYNGASATYNPVYAKIMREKDDPNHVGMGWYLHSRNTFRIMTLFQGEFGESNWGWAAGLTYYDIRVNTAKNKDINPEMPSLYKKYLEYGVIPVFEQYGGKSFEAKAGIKYDTRDNESYPTRGTNFEVFAFGSPKLFCGAKSYLDLAVHFKQFHSLFNDKAVFAYHLAYQGLIAGQMPFYKLQNIQNLHMKQINAQGIGSSGTVRGTASPRFVGNGYAWANTELRIPIVKFYWIKQNWAIVTNPFLDAGMVVQPYNLKEQIAAQDKWKQDAEYIPGLDLYSGKKEHLHITGGLGLHVIMNTNFNVSCEVGKSAKEDGGFGMSISLNYIF